MLRLIFLAGAGYAAYRAYQSRQQDAGTVQTEQTSATTPGSEEPNLSAPDPANAVMPDGAEANEKIGARTIGDNG